MNQIKVWVQEQQIKKIKENGFPDSYSFQPKEGFVEMSISGDEFLKWQQKDKIQERANHGRQLLKD